MCFYWSRRESNPRPSRCERDALPTELRPQCVMNFSENLIRLVLSRGQAPGCVAENGRTL